ncbi:C4b-binding protein alpha chain isoform X4 [Misgurnus anguillicaudatus]|uniref:C4b-binding protein alpha chain isoform X4 n=1 Tax=Misgurnus anguillicaudatus TaxID=75329 RepID=UPI003CCFD8EE
MTNAKTWLLLLLYALVSMVKADCPSPVLNTTYLLSDKSLLQNSFPDNSKAFLQCANGYIFESGSTSILCTDGNWSEVELKCKKKDCGVPNASANMTYIISKGTLFGEYAQPKCDKGYRLQGSSYRQCLVHGWTGRAKCILITCDQPADIEHGKILTKVNPIFVDQVIEFSCDAGYVLVGEKNITCDEYGEYSSPPPTCEVKRTINCTVPEVMFGIQIKGSPPYSYKSQATFKCLSGYSMTGLATAVCEERGWSDLPVCV